MIELDKRIEMFEEPLHFIQDEKIKAFAIKGIERLPEYFFEVPASSTGKYHPLLSHGKGGLYRHTLFALRFLVRSYNLEFWGFTQKEKDLMIVALLLHDGWKHGMEKTEFTIAEHPEVSYKMIKKLREDFPEYLSEEDVEILGSCIYSHMGEWNKDRKNVEILPKPSNLREFCVHLADYNAATTYFSTDFDMKIY